MAAIQQPGPNPSGQPRAGLRAFRKALEHLLGKRFVLDQPEELLTYECDACTLVKIPPELVALPATTEEVAGIIKLCNQYQIPFTARGAGTGLSGGAIPKEGGVVISLNRMNRILAIDTDNRTATVEVGVVNAWLNRELEPLDYFYAPDPSSQSACTLGGNIAENAGGIHCVKYGVTSDHILALEVVLPDGEIVWLGSHTRHSHGLNLLGVMVGSEGTLGVATRAVVKILPRPQSTRVYLAAFDEVAHSTEAVAEIIRTGLNPAALEFMDVFTIKAVNQAFGVGFPESSQAVLLIELDGAPQAVEQYELKLKEILDTHHITELRIGETEAERQQLWKARKLAVAAYGRYQPAFYLHDCVIPRSQLTFVLQRIEEIAQKYDLMIGNVFHAGDGNLHPNILFDPDKPEMVRNVLAGGEEILEVCLSVGGVLSGEHGIGLEKNEYMVRLFSEADLEKMSLLKQVFDPAKLANPAKVFPQRAGCGEVKNSAHLTAINQTAATEGPLWI